MNQRQRLTSLFDRTDYDNRWYRWLAFACALIASGLLTAYLLQ